MKARKPNAGFDFSSKEARDALNCISDCFLTKNPIPEWAQKTLIKAVARANTYQIKSWDEVFGRPLEKGKQLIAERRKLELMEPIFEPVRECHEAGQSITKDLFEFIGEEFGLSGTVASEIYYAKKDIINELEIFHSATKSIE